MLMKGEKEGSDENQDFYHPMAPSDILILLLATVTFPEQADATSPENSAVLSYAYLIHCHRPNYI
jgi:hypothetical protein